MKKKLLGGLAATTMALALFTSVLASPASAAPWWKRNVPSITEIVAQSGGDFDTKNDYDLLLNAVLAADLGDALADPNASLTVWAPNDRAFIRLAQDLGYGGSDEAGAFDAIVAFLSGLPGGLLPNLTAVLTYHVTPGERNVFQVVFTRQFPTLQGATIDHEVSFAAFFNGNILKLRDQDPGLADPSLTFPLQVNASNGVIHTIDRVLIPVNLTGA